jgi:cytochrome P450
LSASTRSPGDLMDQELDRFVARLYAAHSPGFARPSSARMLFVEDPADYEIVARESDVFVKDFSAFAGFGDSRLSTNGEGWRQRRALSHAQFTDAGRPGNRGKVAAAFADRVARLSRAGSPSFEDLHIALLEASVIVLHKAFGHDVEPSGPLRVLERGRALMRRMQRIVLFGAAPGESARAHAGARELVTGLKRAAPSITWLRDLLGSLETRAAAGGGPTDFEAVEEYLFLFLAGVETSVASSLWVVDRLGLHAGLQERFRDELRATGESSALECFIDETMRRFPAIPFVARVAAKPFDLNGRTVAQGQPICVSIVGLHHHPDYWEEPQIFKPERAEFVNGTYDRRAFVPFISGPRICGGAKLARAEVSEAVKAFLTHFRSERTEIRPTIDVGVSMRPAPGSLVALRRL